MAFIQPFGDLPGIDLTENNTVIDHNVSPHFGLDMRPSDPMERPCAGTRMVPHHASLQRTSHLCSRLLKMEQSVNDLPESPPYSLFGNDHGSTYHFGAVSEMDIDMHSHFVPLERYSSPNGPWGGDQSYASESESGLSPAPSRSNLPCYDAPVYTSPFLHGEDYFQAIDQCGFGNGDRRWYDQRSVALHEVQHFPDLDPEVHPSSETLEQKAVDPAHEVALLSYPDEVDADADTDADVSVGDEEAGDDPTYCPSRHSHKGSGVIPSQRRSGKPVTNRVGKRAIRRTTSSNSPTRPTSRDSASNRLFICSFAHYGCESTFASKNEWKRHVTSQHLQLGFYRCEVGDCNPSKAKNNKNPSKSAYNNSVRSGTAGNRIYNDFNRKDLFTQHQRRMHAPWLTRGTQQPMQVEKDAFEASLEKLRDSCWQEKRKPPQQSQCGFCGQKFAGRQSWDDRMEHVGKHFEKRESNVETEDLDLRAWALREGIICPVGENQWRLSSLQLVNG